jgi:hypothetical protein
MSFDKLKVAELKKVAEEFAVDLDGVSGKAAIIAELEDNGVTYEFYEERLGNEDDSAPAPVEVKKQAKMGDPDTMVVKMERQNLIYETHGLRFTRDHPFALATHEQAQEIFDTEEGFRPATPRELQDYYK